MSCSDIISIIDIAVSAGVGIWVATAIAKGQTKERFLKEYFTHELISIKEECKFSLMIFAMIRRVPMTSRQDLRYYQ